MSILPLAISEINLSEARELNRFDAEYFEPNHLRLNSILTKKSTKAVSSFAVVTDGIHESIDFDDDSIVNLLSAMSPKENYFDISKNKTISESQHKANPRTALQINDIIISTVGTIGNCAVIDKDLLSANSDRHVGIIRIHDGYLPRYLSTFLLTKYGRFQTFRESTGNVQLNLFIEKLLTLRVPIATLAFQERIEVLIARAQLNRSKSIKTYNNAEQLLLDATGLGKYKSTIRNVSVRTFADFSIAARLDAEYWNLDYDDIEALVKDSPFGFHSMRDAFHISDEKFELHLDKVYEYIQLADINPRIGTVESSTELLGSELPSRARMKVRNRDILVSSVEGSVSKIALVSDSSLNLIGSTGFIVLREKELLSEVALVLLKCPAIQQLIKRQAQGSILTAVPKITLGRIIIPKIDSVNQEKIAAMIIEVHNRIYEADIMFAKAKRAVEIFIEKDETTAINFLNS
jgi:hypothetical protein